MGHAAGEVVTDLLAAPAAQKVSTILTGTARVEIVKRLLPSPQTSWWHGPTIGAMSLLDARDKHPYRIFIDRDHPVFEHCFAQRTHQLLQLPAGNNSASSPRKNPFLLRHDVAFGNESHRFDIPACP